MLSVITRMTAVSAVPADTGEPATPSRAASADARTARRRCISKCESTLVETGASGTGRWQALPGLDADRQAVLRGRQRAREARVVDARRVVGEVEVDRVRPVALGIQVEVSAGAVRLGAARRIEKGQEHRLGIPVREAIAGEAVPGTGELELERARALGVAELAVGCRDLEA